MKSNKKEQDLNFAKPSAETAPITGAEIKFEPTAEQEQTREQERDEQGMTSMMENDGQKRKIRLPSFKRKPTAIPQYRDEITVKIEKILEEGLNEPFQRLSPIAQQEFKLKGEQTAFKIRELMRGAHVKIKKIFRLIIEWLRMLPGVNIFFLEQEAKIKADKILALKERER